jgi:hypothetical protein
VIGWRRLRRLAAAPALLLALVRPASASGSFDADLWDALLAAHTREVPDAAGVRVDYGALRREPRWPALLESLAGAAPPEEAAARLAFWINAYNVLAIQTVLRAYPIDSIKDVGSLFSPVWKRPAGKIEGKTVTLDQIEHEILRPMGDPRIHAAIICASRSCPSLRREPYTVAGVNAQLDESMRRFLADKRKGLELDTKTGRLRLSSIFKWFAEDFEKKGGVVAFVARYAPTDVRTYLGAHPNPKLEYFSYDWQLNGVPASAQASRRTP